MQYVQYTIVDTNPIKAGVSITKGHVNTVDANGYLIALTASAGAADNLNVVFQAMASSAAVSGEADSTVQVLRQRSRILMKAPVNVTPGDDVTWWWWWWW